MRHGTRWIAALCFAALGIAALRAAPPPSHPAWEKL
jgi:hypothetical protein